MKTRINLYQEQFKPVYYLVNPSLVFGLWLLCIIAVVVFSVLTEIRVNRVETELDTATKLVKSKQDVTNLLAESVANLKQDPELVATIQRRQEVLAVKNSVMAELAKRHDQKSNGFAQLMLDLARNHHPELWLKTIYLNDAQIRIEGGAAESSAVPKWVNHLSNAEYFQGRSFASAHMYRDGDEQLMFVLNSQSNEEASEGGDNE